MDIETDKLEQASGEIPFDNKFDALLVIAKHSVPIMIRDQNGKLLLEGSSVYFTDGSKYYLVTANHVISKYRIESIILALRKDYATSIPAKKVWGINNSIADIAIIELSNALEIFEPLHINAIDDIQKEENIFLMGFPCTKNSIVCNSILFDQRFIITKILHGDETYFSEFDPKINFVCNFKKENVLLGNGKRATFPTPVGMSGGGAYEVLFNKDYSLRSYKLIGIMTDWNEQKQKYIRCTFSRLIKFLLNNG